VNMPSFDGKILRTLLRERNYRKDVKDAVPIL
jgi:hypothetical protein